MTALLTALDCILTAQCVSKLMQSSQNSHGEQTLFLPNSVVFLKKPRRCLALSATFEYSTPKRKAVGSNPAGEAKKVPKLGTFFCFLFHKNRATKSFDCTFDCIF